jgi:hypothetical protein
MTGHNLGVIELIILAIVGLVLLALFVFAWARVFAKAGYSPLLCILMLVPAVGQIVFLWFAFARWPIHKHSPGVPHPAPED